MRQPKTTQEPLRTPLNQYLGTEGNVRVLRVLSANSEPLARTVVAERAELHPTGVRRILDALAGSGLVDVIGSGRNQAVRLRDEHPMAGPLRQLYREEREVFERVSSAVRNAVATLSKPIDAVWLESPEARSSGIVDLGVLAPPDVVDHAARELTDRLSPLAENLALHFAAHGYTQVDAGLLPEEEQERLRNVTLLYGWIPLQWRREGGGPIRSHRELDDRARRIATPVAERLSNDPSIIDRALEWIDDRLESAGEREAPALEEWRSLLTRLSIPQIQKLLMEDTERARELRQSLPFAEALPARERRSLISRGGNA